jgi:hypothetical protein
MILILAPSGLVHAALIDSSNIFRLDFDFSNETQVLPPTEIQISLYFDQLNSLDTGEGYKLQVFNSSNHSATDLFSYNHLGSSTPSIGNSFGFNGSPIDDNIGYILFTDIVGSFDLIHNSVQMKKLELNVFSLSSQTADLSVSQVPIPSAILLLSSGLIGCVGFRKKFKQ